MAITKDRKQALVAQYRDLLRQSKGVVLVNYTGLSVKDMEALRRKIRELGGEFHVVKNRLAKLAFREAGLPVPDFALTEPTVIGFAAEDIPGVTKTIVDAGREIESLRIKGGVIDGVLYQARQVEMLAELPALPVLRARLLGLLQAPAGRVAGALAGSVRQVVSVVKAYSEAGAA